MRVMVALEDRFYKTSNGDIYSNTTCDYNFWRRYLQVFDEVIVLARVCEIGDEKLDKLKANGEGVSFFELPYYVGPLQYLQKYLKVKKSIRQSVDKSDAFILRIPGTIGTMLSGCLEKLSKPYAVEVVGDALDSMNTAGANSLLRAMLCRTAPRDQKKQCQNAVAASYVSEFYLQDKYPPGCWSTHYSTLDLPDDAIVEDGKLEEKVASLKDVAEGKRPLRICHAGTMEVAYKAQDVLLEAVALCRAEGVDAEVTFLGEGRRSEFYADKARELGIEKYVEFLGMLPAGDAVRKQLDLSDMFVLPSATEGLPRIIIEAMARALPCIATNVGGIPEMLKEEDMVLPGDSKMLAAKIASVAGDFERMGEMSRRNLEVSKTYCFEVLNGRRVEFYSKVAEASNGLRQ